MLILLPPSEGKNQPTGSPPLEQGSLIFADQLGDQRRHLITALEKLAGRPVEKAIKVMEISPGLAPDIARNGEITVSPAAPAREVYSGVLYERLGLDRLGKRASGRADRHLLIASALWGMIRPSDRIPYYRLSAKPKLARVGGLGAFWRKPLAAAMADSGFDEEGEIVLDLRSGPYISLWRPKRARLIAVRGFTEVDGKRKAISHMAKSIRGDVARAVLEAPKMPRDADTVAEVARRAGMTIELTDSTIDVIESD